MNSEFELIYDFEIGDELSDVELHVETKVFRVHKAILASASPVFRKMFTADFLERASNRVHLPDKQADDILELLKMIYPNQVHEFDGINVVLFVNLLSHPANST